MDAVSLERHDGGVAAVTLNRPEKRNALSAEIRDGLTACLTEALADEAVRAIVVAGRDGTFCAGGDVSTMHETPDPISARRRMRSGHPVVRLLQHADKPVVAAVQGHAVGAGAGLALLCDTIVMGEGAVIGFPFFRIGLVPDWAILYTLPRRVGVGAAKQLLLGARMLQGPDALALSLADEVVPDGDVPGHALAAARRLGRQPRLAFAVTKQALHGHPMGFDEVLALEATAQPLARQTADHEEGRAAFMAKRSPRFG